MTPGDFVLLVIAGIAGGLTGSIAGLASVVSYPALLALGLTPIAANVTNTVALTANSVGSVSASRPELAGQRDRLVRLLGVAIAGGICGGVLLLLTPSDSFAKVVPWLIGLSSAAMLLPRRSVTVAPTPDVAAGPRAVSVRRRPHREHPLELTIGTAVIGLYAGYFGAAAGVLLLALLLRLTDAVLPVCNALKNVVLGGANGVAAIGFAIFGPVNWAVALPLAIGFLVGGRLGPRVVRRVPETPLRIVIAAAGIVLAVKLALDAY